MQNYNFFTKLYRKKNGELMIYINASNESYGALNVGVSDKVYTSKMSKPQKTLLNKWFENFQNLSPVIEDFKELETHKEDFSVLDMGLKIFITDAALVAGNKVNGDGAYISYENKLFSLHDLNGSYEN